MSKSGASWICGGTRGIGKAIADQCVELGQETYVSGRTGNTDLPQESPAGILSIFSGDLEEREVAESQVREIFRRSGKHVNSLYFAVHRECPIKQFESLRWDDFIEQFEGSVKPVFNVVQSALAEGILRQDAAIVVLSSVTVALGADAIIPRNVSKGALEALVRSLSSYLGDTGIRVNGISVGWTETDQLEAYKRSGGIVPVTSIPLNRVAKTDEIARTALFLGTSQSSYMTGTVLPVAGGLSPTVR